MTLSTKEIMEIIPHRNPFLLIDQIVELEPAVRAVGKKCVSMNEPYFVGHFPGEPVMPGVLILEAMAQVGAVLCLSEEAYRGKTAYFGGVNKARFRNKVVPGDVMLLEANLIKIKGPLGIATAKAYSAEDEKKIFAEAEITFMIG
ncbi:MAG: 3-hydroxyacyl-ACP dehydratase FabZ [Lachnospiraceae bacterium]|nr:3-hydroxyacyl-ACP dehydratase FabZ [Lachnospiraceae bacterium]